MTPATPVPSPTPENAPQNELPEDLSQVSQNPLAANQPVFNPPVTDQMNQGSASQSPIPENISQTQKSSSSKKWVMIGGLIVVLLIAAGATYFLLVSKSSSSQDTISLPATQAPLTNPPKQVKASASPSAMPADMVMSPSPSASTSAFDQLKAKQKTSSPAAVKR
jgi:hypothetical protein